MPDMAICRETGNYHFAAEVAFNSLLEDVRWKCMGCDVSMFPVAADGKPYKRPAYFRLAKGAVHLQDCEGPGFEGLGGRIVRNRVGVPERLVLRAIDDQTPRDPADRDDDQQELANREPRGGGNLLPAGATVGALFPLVAYLRTKGADLSHPLSILDWETSPYKYNFKRLRGQVDLAAIHPRRVHYASISVDEVFFDDDGITVALAALSGNEHLSVRFDTRMLTRRQTRVVENAVRAYCVRQRELVTEGSSKAVTLYFIGARTDLHSRQFVLADPRLFCFREEPL